MSTKNLMKKFSELAEKSQSLADVKNFNLLGDLKSHSCYYTPLFTIVGAVLKTKTLMESGIELSITEMILPHAVLTFGPSIIANSIVPRYKPEPKDFLIYFIGFLASLLLQNNSFAMTIIKEIPHFAKFFALLNMKNSPDDTFGIFLYAIVSDLTGKFLTKLITKKKYKISTKDLLSMVVVNVGVFLLRVYKMSDYLIISVANIIPMVIAGTEFFKSKKQELPVTPRKAKRKASVSAQIEKKNK